MTCKFLGDGSRLFRIAGVVADFELELLAKQATSGIKVSHRPFRAVLHLPAEC
jgi:hypothetical protein